MSLVALYLVALIVERTWQYTLFGEHLVFGSCVIYWLFYGKEPLLGIFGFYELSIEVWWC